MREVKTRMNNLENSVREIANCMLGGFRGMGKVSPNMCQEGTECVERGDC
jgi:hypothetical protein